ncbi:MAG: RimK family alpha-L-glutamate ligase [Gammaproteobacteria bacterium]|nr:RimK family alpha-L-glutamate ligase [Gammaproteobacteria bacterium]
MHVAILSQSTTVYSTSRLVDCCLKRGHTVEAVNPLRCALRVQIDGLDISYQERRVAGVDVVIPRIDPAITAVGTAVLSQFEAMGVWSLNESAAIHRSRDKLRALQLLAKAGVPIPNTVYGETISCIKQLMARAGSVVIKPVRGSKGQGVVVVNTVEGARSAIEQFVRSGTRCLIQEFVGDRTAACDIRCFVVGDHLIAAMIRTAKTGELRANIHLGAKAKAVTVNHEERAMCLRAVHALGLTVAGVDLIRSPRGVLVLEVNSSPGLEGIEKATQCDVADAMIAYAEQQHTKRNSKTTAIRMTCRGHPDA